MYFSLRLARPCCISFILVHMAVVFLLLLLSQQHDVLVKAFNANFVPQPTRIAFGANAPPSQMGRYIGSGLVAEKRRNGISSLSSKGDDSDGVGGTKGVPFFARFARRRLASNDNENASSISPPANKDGGGTAIAKKEPEIAKEDIIEVLPSRPRSPEDLAADLKRQAEKVRLEAEKMDTKLTIEKLSKLEKKLENKDLFKDDEENGVQAQIDTLTKKLNRKYFAKEPQSPSASPKARTAPPMAAAEVVQDEVCDDITPISEKELKERSQAFLKTPLVLQEMTAKAAGFKDVTNVTGIIKQIYIDEQKDELGTKRNKDGEIEPLDEKALENALEGYTKLPLAIQDMIAKSAGLPDGRNATDVIAKLEKDGRLFGTEDGVEAGFEVGEINSSDMEVIFEDLESMEKSRYIESMLPKETRKAGDVPTDEDINVFFTQVLNNKQFNPTGKPENIPGGFLIRGQNRMKSGDELVAALEESFSKTNISETVQFYYMRDPNPSTDEEFERYENDLPVIVVTGRDLTPDTSFLTKSAVSLLGLFFVSSFSLAVLTFNEVLFNRLDAEIQAGTADPAWLQTLALPTVLAIFVTQIVHELSHQAAALKGDFKAGLPTIIPNPQIGLQGAITPITSSPKNLKALFDFAIAGPLSGVIISLLLLYSGLEATAFTSPDDQALLPGLPMELVRSSALAGGMVEWLLGDGILLSPNPAAATVLLHPLAIAGLVGLINNALALLPVGNTDGGRIAQSLFGRKWARVISGLSLVILVLSGLFGLDQANLLLSYTVVVAFWQRNPELPCRNEVDDVEIGRGFVAIAAALLASLILIPLQ